MGIDVAALEYCIILRKTVWTNNDGASPGLIPDLLVIRALLAAAGPDDESALLSLRALAVGDPDVVALIDLALLAISANYSRLKKLIGDGFAWHWVWECETTSDNTPLGSKKTNWMLRLVATS